MIVINYDLVREDSVSNAKKNFVVACVWNAYCTLINSVVSNQHIIFFKCESYELLEYELGRASEVWQNKEKYKHSICSLLTNVLHYLSSPALFAFVFFNLSGLLPFFVQFWENINDDFNGCFKMVNICVYCELQNKYFSKNVMK